MSGNGSYQKYDGSSGTYQDISTGTKPSGKAKWLIGIVVTAVLGSVYFFTTNKNGRDEAEVLVDKSIKTIASAVRPQKEAKIKLFDDLSKYKRETNQ